MPLEHGLRPAGILLNPPHPIHPHQILDLKQCNFDKEIYILPIVFKFKPQSGIQHHIHHLSDPYKGEDGWGGVVTVLYIWD